MPYLDVVRTHGRNNRFQYDHKAIYKQVRQAMKKRGEEREQALKAVFTSAYRKEAVRYEAMRQQMTADLYSMENANEAARLDFEMRSMARPAQFLEQMAEIVGEMAKDIDRNYQPAGMFGLTARDAKNLVGFQLNSYTRLDETMYSLKRFGWEDAHRALRHLITDVMTNEPRTFATTDDEHKVSMYMAYIRKEELKKQLDGKGFFWKLRHRAEVREMNNYINAAEAALTAVAFPESAIGEARFEVALTAAKESEYEAAYKYLDEKFHVAPIVPEQQPDEKPPVAPKEAEEKLGEELSVAPNESEKKLDEELSVDPNEMELMLDGKTEEELLEIFDQRAADEDQAIDQINEREAQEKRKEQEMENQARQARLDKLLNIPKPQTYRDVPPMVKNKETAGIVRNVFIDILKKYGASSADHSITRKISEPILMDIKQVWVSPNQMHQHSMEMFKTVYGKIRIENPQMSVSNKLIATQKITDILLNVYSPVASDPKLAQYGNNYCIQKMNNADIRSLTGSGENLDELMNHVKVELGLAKAKENEKEAVVIPAEVFADNAGGVSEKVEEIKPAHKELEV